MTAVLKCIVKKISTQNISNTLFSYQGITAGVISLGPVHFTY